MTKEEKIVYQKQYDNEHKSENAARKAKWYKENKERIAEQQLGYRQQNADSVKRNKREYYENNKELMLSRSEQYYKEHVDEIKERMAKYYIENKDTLNEKSREWVKNNRERFGLITQRWNKKNPDVMSESGRKYRAEKLSAEINDFTKEQWFDMLIEYDNTCVYCGKNNVPMTQDHVVPLSKGGNHTKSNIVPACLSCNCRKNAMTVDEFMQRNFT